MYILYTSGATGRPKGVQINHRAVTTFFAINHAIMRFDAGDTWAITHSYAFDLSVWEMWGALLFGGRLVIMPTATTQSPDALYNILLTHSVTVLCQTPSAVRQLMEVRQTRDEPLALRIVTIALEVPLLDLSGSARADQQLAVRRIAAQTAQEPFDLQRGPLIRTRLLRLDTDRHLLLLILHHTIADGWSLSIVWRELAALYAAAHSEQPSDLPELPIQYADVSHWQRQWLQGTVLETQLAYWRKQFADRPPALELPTDHPRPPVQTFAGAVQRFKLDKPLQQQLTEVSRREGVTLFMTLLAAFKVVLARYSGQTDVVVGTPIANRRHRETQAIIGFFANTLALRPPRPQPVAA